MTTAELTISFGVGLISFLVALLTFFANKWVETLEKGIQQNTKDIQNQSQSIRSLELSNFDMVEKVSDKVIKKFSGEIEHLKNNSLKVTVLEKRMNDTGHKINSIFDSIRAISKLS